MLCFISETKGLKNSETRTFIEEFESRWSQIWFNNHTYGLFRLPMQKNMIGCKWRDRGSSVA